MKTPLLSSLALLASAALLISLPSSYGREFGVSASSYGRGTTYTTSRGGQAYVGPRGAVGETAGGRYGAATDRGVAVAGPNGAAAAGRYGAVAAGPEGAAAVGRYGGTTAVTTSSAAVVRTPAVASLPSGYIRTVPVGYTTVVYGGYSCMFVGGVYYRPVIYGGETVYVVVP
jgi:hypothetical protein